MNFEDQQIYDEMEMSSRNPMYRATYKRNGSGIVGKILASVLFISVGFAAGNFYRLNEDYSKASLTKLNNPETKFIQTVSNEPAQNVAVGDELSIRQIAAMNQDSVVEIQIQATANNSFFGTYTTTGSGSGIIISSDGYILTNHHVVDDANEISIRLHDGTEYKAKVIGTDSKTDVAVLKVDAKNLKAVTIGDSSKLSVGDTAVVIGNPLGKLGGTVTNGIISALEREITIDGVKKNLIQTNAAINPGNSGGGLFNSNGELVGIVEAKSSGLDVEGLGFAIPVNDVKEVINDILNLGYVSGRPYLGVSLADSKQIQRQGGNSIFDFYFGSGMGTYTTTQYGAYVKAVEEGSAADKAGIKVDDQIISINDTMVSSSSDVTSAIAQYKVGDTVKVGLVRDNKMMTVQATLNEYKGQTSITTSSGDSN